MTNLNRIDDADHGGINRAILAAECHPRGATLDNEDDFMYACSHRINRDQVAFFVPAFDIDHSGDKQLAPVEALILPGGNDCSDYSSKKHDLIRDGDGRCVIRDAWYRG